jgi:hypothetical protein
MRRKKEDGENNNKKESSSRKQHSIIQKHEQKLEEFKNKEGRIENTMSKIKVIKKELDKLYKERSYKQLNRDCIDEIRFAISDREEELKKLEEQLEIIKSGNDEIEYLLNSYELVVQYITLDDDEKQLLLKQSLNDLELNQLNRIKREKNDISDQYLSKYQANYSLRKSYYSEELLICNTCEIELEFSDGFLVCYNCGMCKQGISDENAEMSYKDKQNYDYRPQFTYDKQSHLDDWLRRFQAKENRVIPQEVLDKVILEAKKERIKDLNLLTEEKVKRFLKKLNLNEYYDNVIGIINRINGRPPFTLTVEIEEKIKTMFQQIQAPYEKHKPEKRKNFLSYSYTLHKFFQILGLHEFSKYFPLLKSAEKLRQQDEIFKKVVAEMAQKDKTVNWVFYPSI